MGKEGLQLIHLDFGESVHGHSQLVTSAMRAARQRLSLSREAFAALLQRRAPGAPVVSPGAVEAWEAGTMPPADVYQAALAEAGLRLDERVREWLDEARAVIAPGLISLLPDFSEVLIRWTAPLSPFW